MTDSSALVLGIETSCDETAAAVVRNGREVLSSVIYSQIEKHSPYGGVVPEIASRSHAETLPAVVSHAMQKAGKDWRELDRIAATRGPGLASSLLVGWSASKGLARRLQTPLWAVNHIEAHIASVFLDPAAPPPCQAVPMTILVVSGGHTSLFKCRKFGEFELIGRTIDDAAGEALDKAAKLLGLGYPGGPVIDRLAKEIEVTSTSFPSGQVRTASAPLGNLRPELCFSFSGLKTALLRRLQIKPPDTAEGTAFLAAEYQEAVVNALVERCGLALDPEDRYLAVGGGVSMNSRLRTKLKELCRARDIGLLLAKPEHCGDNAAMIAGACGLGLGLTGQNVFTMDILPNWTAGCAKADKFS